MGPQTDFDVLARHLHGRISYPGGGSAATVALEARLRLDLSQAVRATRTGASAYVSLSERVGIPLSLLKPDAPILLIAHLLTSAQKQRVAKLTGFLHRTDVTLVFSKAQERYLCEEVGLSGQRARFISDKVDHRFFSPADDETGGSYVLSVGREQRDYETLVEALRPLKMPGVIVAGSTWSHRQLAPISVPSHVEVRQGISYSDLRDLYHGARLVVVPVLSGTDYAAGVNAILEGMSCARPVIATLTPGLDGYVRDGEDGREVEPGDASALRSVIEELWTDRQQAERLARAGRATVERERTIDHFVAGVSEVVGSLV